MQIQIPTGAQADFRMPDRVAFFADCGTYKFAVHDYATVGEAQ